MPVATTTKPHVTAVKVRDEPRAILGPAGNRVSCSVPDDKEQTKRKNESLNKKPQKPRKPGAPETAMSVSAVRNNASVDSTCSSDSSYSSSLSSSKSSGSSVKTVKSRSGVRRVVKSVGGGSSTADVSVDCSSGPLKRCDWITPYSDPLYSTFHDEEWGVPVHDDAKMFELLVFSLALAELSWPAILQKRDVFRKLFHDFDPSSIAQFDEKNLLSLRVNGSLLLSEPKLRAILENAKQVVKLQREFGSFSNFCWSFVNHKPVRNGFKYARQVPVKSPKAEFISKNLMQRGFCCVGPTVIYSFMQAAGIVNDHLVSCFRYQQCNEDVKKDAKPNIDKTPERNMTEENTCLSCD